MPLHDILQKVCGTSNRLRLALRGGGVQRFHTEDLPVRQSVAEHTWRVLVIMDFLWPETSLKLFKVTLYHDIAEGLTGDIPSPIKRHSPGIKAALNEMEDELFKYLKLPNEFELDIEEYNKLKCADYLELICFCRKQNTEDARRMISTVSVYIEEAATRLDHKDRSKVLALLKEI